MYNENKGENTLKSHYTLGSLPTWSCELTMKQASEGSISEEMETGVVFLPQILLGSNLREKSPPPFCTL